jgi:tetratricopeptide (TPR) repeat protein
MRVYTRFFVALTLLVSGIPAACALSAAAAQQNSRRTRGARQKSVERVRRAARSPQAAREGAREDAFRANNLGVALLEQFKHQEGAEEFRRALRLDPRLGLARINLAIALYNVPDLARAALEARAAQQLEPDAPQPAYILGLIAKSQNRMDDALAAFRRVLRVDARDVGANVNIGQLYAQRREYPAALQAFRTALEAEPYNGTALYNLATALLRSGQRDEGQRLMQRFQELRASGAATVTGQNYLEQGRYAEAVTSTGAEPELVDRRTPDVAFVNATATMLPHQRSGARRATPGATLASRATLSLGADASEFFRAGADIEEAKRNLVAALGGSVTLFDADSDGDLDMLDVEPFAQRLYRNDGGKFVAAAKGAGELNGDVAEGVNVGAVAGDFDNDSRADILILRYGQPALYRNLGDGRFQNVTASAGIPRYPFLSISAAFADVDHDGDLDIFLAGLADLSKQQTNITQGGPFAFPSGFSPAPNLLLRNNGNAAFSDITETAKVSGISPNARKGHAVAVVPTDYDNRRDVDLFIVNFDAPNVLYRNMRDGTFADTAGEAGIHMRDVTQARTCAAAGDFNKDGYTDFLFGTNAYPSAFAVSDGRGRFRVEPNRSQLWHKTPSMPPGPQVAQFIDYDNDGLLDVVGVSGTSLLVWRNVGRGWVDVTMQAATGKHGVSIFWSAGWSRTLASGDLDLDGDTDLVLRSISGELVIARNDGGSRNRSTSVRLHGKVSNRSGIGAKVEARAGSLRQKLETYSATPAPAPADVVFGLGKRAGLDAVRVLWPAGIVQSETENADAPTLARNAATNPNAAPRAVRLTIEELDRKPSSCPYLYAWNGERFEFVTDFMGGGELGYYVAPDVRAAPDPDEYVRIGGDQLRAREGHYELRVTNELEEALFIDKLELVAVAHPRGVEVYPNEGLGNPTSSAFKLYTTRAARPPRAATDEHGHDVLARIARLDRRYPDDFQLLPIRGYAAEHTLTLDLSEATKDDALLLLTGWTDYAFSSDNVAAAQRGLSLAPPALQVRDARGRWQTVIEDIGIPVGRPQTVTVDLKGKFLTSRREVRIVTNMRIYWDSILLDTSPAPAPFELTRLFPARALLRWRGYSAELSPDGREPFGYEYARVVQTSPWKTLTGRYTREGDVRELLDAADDMFVVSRSGDELALSFDARALPPLPRGWTRTFLLYANGYSKEMDINSASPEQVAPLPFHKMKNYPYAPPETYPDTPAHRAYIERYNTRLVASEIVKW